MEKNMENEMETEVSYPVIGKHDQKRCLKGGDGGPRVGCT